ncbi:DUF4384 domain-containing protein [Desulfobacter latus]|uniref:DUF4384 domain-containing protein n=1 Tax=Desulfobacter latus TaxID=2292 RepID=A0A850T2N9_9BACT|nr:DUF4384 domain-containing protein [Desulfobacter latus]NWH05993.1 DUF4384 domain-containing protein [Desulfobacter latus]
MRNVLIMLTGLAISLALFTTGCKNTEYVHVGPNWQALHDMEPENDAFSVSVTGSQKASLGKPLSYTVHSAKTGKLWVVQVDPDDKVSVIVPNAEMQDHQILKNVPLHIPPRDAHWEMAAMEPVGKSVLGFFVTTGDEDIGDILSQGQGTSKAIRVRPVSGWGMDKMVVDIKP